jgi:hypothetical protein
VCWYDQHTPSRFCRQRGPILLRCRRCVLRRSRRCRRSSGGLSRSRGRILWRCWRCRARCGCRCRRLCCAGVGRRLLRRTLPRQITDKRHGHDCGDHDKFFSHCFCPCPNFSDHCSLVCIPASAEPPCPLCPSKALSRGFTPAGRGTPPPARMGEGVGRRHSAAVRGRTDGNQSRSSEPSPRRN